MPATMDVGKVRMPNLQKIITTSLISFKSFLVLMDLLYNYAKYLVRNALFFMFFNIKSFKMIANEG